MQSKQPSNLFKAPLTKLPIIHKSNGQPTLIETEISIIFNLYKKTQDLLSAPAQMRMAHDPEKWKKKF